MATTSKVTCSPNNSQSWALFLMKTVLFKYIKKPTVEFVGKIFEKSAFYFFSGKKKAPFKKVSLKLRQHSQCL